MSNRPRQLPKQSQEVDLIEERVGIDEHTFSFSEVAKILNTGMGRNTFITLLRRWRYIVNKREPSQSMISRGYMKLVLTKIKLKDRPARFEAVGRVTISGLVFLQRKVRQHFKNHIQNQRPLP
jgi:hypothetical protein